MGKGSRNRTLRKGVAILYPKSTKSVARRLRRLDRQMRELNHVSKTRS